MSTQTQINMFSKNKINFGYREEFDKRMLKANKKYFMRALNSIQKQVHPNKKVTISLVILPDSIVKEMNKEYRGVDKATDVLSFPLGTEHKGVIDLGDVVVGKMKWRENCEENGNTLERELVFLFIHSLLHLVGHTHESDKNWKKMKKLEQELLSITKINI